MRVHLFIFCKRLHRNSPPNTWTHNLAWQYSCFRSNYCPTLYSRVITESDLPTNHSIVFNHNATTNSGLRRDDYTLSYVAVVTDVNHIIDLRSAPNARAAKRSAVHASMRS